MQARTVRIQSTGEEGKVIQQFSIDIVRDGIPPSEIGRIVIGEAGPYRKMSTIPCRTSRSDIGEIAFRRLQNGQIIAIDEPLPPDDRCAVLVDIGPGSHGGQVLWSYIDATSPILTKNLPDSIILLAEGKKCIRGRGRFGNYPVKLLLMSPGTALMILRSKKRKANPPSVWIRWDGVNLHIGDCEDCFPPSFDEGVPI
jgi:hypothetical protein